MNMGKKKFGHFFGIKNFSVFLAVLTFIPLGAVHAQDEQDEAKVEQADKTGTIEEVIVTGTAGGSEIRKLDASFSITTADEDDIRKFAPKSTADLLKIIPGVWSESSGGVSGANVFVRGFPGGGDAPFLTVQLNNSPIFPPPTLSFLENTTLFRIDDTIARVEALRGGPNPVFSNGQPGLTTNFLLKEGGDVTEGSVRVSGSDYDLRRIDAVLSGAIAEDLYYMVGGYVSSSPGIRDAGYNAEEGRQFTINITKDLDNGSINVYHRNTDDHGTWYLPAALNVPGIDSDYTQVGTLNRQRQIMFDNNFGDPAFPDPKVKTLDLGEGRGWDGSVSGGSVMFEFDNGWELTDRFSFTSGDADTLGLVPQGGAVQISALLADPTLDPAAVVTGPIMGSVTGNAIATSEYIQQFGAWEVRKNIESFVNDVSFARGWDAGTLTVGVYAASASVDEFWSLGNQKYEVVRAGGEVVTGIACNDPSVDSCTWNYDIDATGDVTTVAQYAAATFYVNDDFSIDAGIRRENHEVQYTVDEGLDGIVTVAIDTDETEYSWTVAGNYAINDHMGVFARINTGSKMANFDDYRDNRAAFFGGNTLIQEVDQFEIGYKLLTDNFALYATGFFTQVDPSIFVALAGGGPGQISTNEATGIEIDAKYFTDTGFSVDLNATFQSSEIKSGVNAGNDQQRQPDFQIRVSPAYEFVVANNPVTVYGSLTAVGERFSDNGNTVVLPSYEKIDLGVVLSVDELTFQLAFDNISDEQGLTEGDPRNPAAPNGRFIMPRSVRFSVGYEF